MGAEELPAAGGAGERRFHRPLQVLGKGEVLDGTAARTDEVVVVLSQVHVRSVPSCNGNRSHLRFAVRVRTTLILTLVLIPACSTGTGSNRGATGTVAVVAAENSWGSLAAQLGGDHARVRSIISNPDT